MSSSSLPPSLPAAPTATTFSAWPSNSSLLPLALWACGDDPPTTPPDPDTEPPVVSVLAPDESGPDVDADGLVDLRLAWPAGDVELESVRVRALDGIGHEVDGVVDLLEAWRVERLDSRGLELEETVENLLHPDLSRIELAASDSAGNVWSDTLELDLSPMAFHRTVPLGTGVPDGIDHCADDGRLYVSVSNAILVLDGDTFEELARIANLDVARVQCIPDQPYLVFSGGDAGVMHRGSLDVHDDLSGTIGLAWSPIDSDHFYAGASGSVSNNIFVYRTNAPVIDEFIEVPPAPVGNEFLFSLAISERARKIFVAMWENARVVDFDTREAGDTLRLPGGLTFTSYDMRLGPDDRNLYVAVTHGQQRGLGLFTVEDDTARFVLETPGEIPIALGVSPSGRRVFMTTQWSQRGVMTSNHLYSVPDGYELMSFPRENETDDTWRDGTVTFHSHGKLLFSGYEFYATGEAFLDVYLNREHRLPGSVGAYDG